MTVHFIEYLPNGKIVLSGTSAADLVANVPALRGGVVVEVSAQVMLSPRAYWSGTALAEMPEQPDEFHVIDWATKTWTDPRTLDELKKAKRAEIKTARDAVIDAPLTTPFGIVDADPVAAGKISQSVLLANNMTALGMVVAIDFTLHDNTVVTLNASQMVTVGLTLAVREQAARGTACALYGKINAAADFSELQSIQWLNQT